MAVNTTEGGLSAPTRHNIDWKENKFYDKNSINDELTRVFEACHGCRRCVSLCQAFPTLFDLIDESENFDLESVDKKDYVKVVDECYMCDLCYQTKCPYVPPHEWAIDFPHLMLRAKAEKFKNNEKKENKIIKLRNYLLSSTDILFSSLSKPVIANIVNFIFSKKIIRIFLENVLKIHRDADLPRMSPVNLKTRLKKLNLKIIGQKDIVKTNKTKGKVKLFSTCYCSNSTPEIAEDLIKVFIHNNIQTEIFDQENCCGMPKLELGDLKSVEYLKNKNIPNLAKAVKDGYDIVSPVPSCVLMFKQELPLLFPNDKDVKLVQKNIFDPFEYLNLRDEEGLFNENFKESKGKIAYQTACHQRVQNFGPKTKSILSKIPESEITMIERCSGHDGTYAIKLESFENSIKIRRPVVSRIKKDSYKIFTSDCPMAAKHISNDLDNNEIEVKLHPISILKSAYGI